MCNSVPFTQDDLRAMSHRELAELLVSVAIGTGDVESARICKEASTRLKDLQGALDEVKADSAEFERRFGHPTAQGITHGSKP